MDKNAWQRLGAISVLSLLAAGLVILPGIVELPAAAAAALVAIAVQLAGFAKSWASGLPDGKAANDNGIGPPAAAFLALGLAIAPEACTPQEAKAATDMGLTVADGVCQEIEGADSGAPPEWVVLACIAEGAAGGAVKVLMPRHIWAMSKAATVAGPGK